MGGLEPSISSSSTACSAAESTSFRVETRCCASTTRHGSRRSGRSSEPAAHCVQILDDIDQPFHAADPFRRHAAEVVVLGVQPGARLCVVPAHERIQRAVDAQEEERELALLGVRLNAASMLEARYGGLAGAEHGGEVALA